jgi:hypothetical protein
MIQYLLGNEYSVAAQGIETYLLTIYYLHLYMMYIITITCFFLVFVSFLDMKLIPAKYVQTRLALLTFYPLPLKAQSAPSFGGVRSCILLRILHYFWGHWGTHWSSTAFFLWRLPANAAIRLDNCTQNRQ